MTTVAIRSHPLAPAMLEAMMGKIGEMVKAQGEYLKSHTVLQTLLYMNSDAKVAQDVGFYYLEARYGEPGDYAGRTCWRSGTGGAFASTTTSPSWWRLPRTTSW